MMQHECRCCVPGQLDEWPMHQNLYAIPNPDRLNNDLACDAPTPWPGCSPMVGSSVVAPAPRSFAAKPLSPGAMPPVGADVAVAPIAELLPDTALFSAAVAPLLSGLEVSVDFMREKKLFLGFSERPAESPSGADALKDIVLPANNQSCEH